MNKRKTIQFSVLILIPQLLFQGVASADYRTDAPLIKNACKSDALTFSCNQPVGGGFVQCLANGQKTKHKNLTLTCKNALVTARENIRAKK